MQHTLRLVLTLVILATGTTAFAACEGRLRAGAQRVVDTTTPDVATFSATVQYYSNVQRCKNGLAVFGTDSGLLHAATVHSNYMADIRALSHTSNVAGYQNLKARMRSANVTMRAAAENVGQNFVFALSRRNISLRMRWACKFTYSDTGGAVPQHSYASLANALVDAWMASAGHRKNLINRRFNRMEAAYAIAKDEATCGYVFASQNFAG